ncbi:MAG: ribosomal protein S18-alanine N-acetyltransferase [Leptospiraceae bacterium]|nr:ribosomal protein S18-alanine N-acetyltransferase [Leptospiraceae bacterium]
MNDLDSLFELEKNCFQLEFWSMSEIEKILQTAQYILLDSEKPVGYIIYLETIDFIEIYRIGIIESMRRNGLGSKLLKTLQSKNKTIFLEVRSDNISAIQFYERNGFKEINRRKNYYENTIDAICFEKTI